MTYWYVLLVGSQSTVTDWAIVTPIFFCPHSGYESVATAEPAVGKTAGNPTWKLFRPLTATMQTERL